MQVLPLFHFYYETLLLHGRCFSPCPTGVLTVSEDNLN